MANLELTIARALSLPRSVRTSMQDSIRTNPTKRISYLPLVDNLASAMIRGYTIGYRANGATLRKDSRTARFAQYRKMVREVLKQYGSSANDEIQRTYRNARDRGRSVNVSAQLAVKRFRSLGHTAPVTNRLATLYRSSIRAAHQQGVFDASRTDPAVWGYRFIAREVKGHKHPTTRDSHYQYHGVTLPKDHEFWNSIWPPLDWNCYCKIKIFRKKQRLRRPPPVPIHIESAFQGQGFELR